MFSFGQFPGVLVLIADVSEPSIGSFFMGRWMNNDWGWDVKGLWYKYTARPIPNHSSSTCP